MTPPVTLLTPTRATLCLVISYITPLPLQLALVSARTDIEHRQIQPIRCLIGKQEFCHGTKDHRCKNLHRLLWMKAMQNFCCGTQFVLSCLSIIQCNWFSTWNGFGCLKLIGCLELNLRFWFFTWPALDILELNLLFRIKFMLLNSGTKFFCGLPLVTA